MNQLTPNFIKQTPRGQKKIYQNYKGKEDKIESSNYTRQMYQNTEQVSICLVTDELRRCENSRISDRFQAETQFNLFKTNYLLYKLDRETMKKLESVETKGDVNDMDETYVETDRQSDCKFIQEDDVAKARENIKWKVVLNQQVTFNNKYVIYELLQSTQHFDLYRAFCQSKRQKVLLKIIDKQSIKQSLRSDLVQNKARIENEQFLKKLKTQVFVQNKLYNKSSRIFLSQPIQLWENEGCFMKITQNYYGESLQSMIKHRQSFPVQQAIAVLKQVVFTLFELHKEGIILTQLNPKHIIYRNGVFKLTDYSSMRKVAQNFKSTLNLYHSYSYENVIAPQIIVCPEIIDIKTEIWALGVLFYQMIQHDVPFQYRCTSIVKQARSHCIKVNLKLKDCCEEVTGLLRKMMEVNPDERISWRNLLNSKILTKKEFFFTPKMTPMIDLRQFSLQKKQSSTIPEQVIINGYNKYPLNIQCQQAQNTMSQLNLMEAFSIGDEKQKINIDQFLDLEEDAFKQVKEVNLMVLKAKWILDEIVMKLQSEKMVNIKKRSHIEMMCLLTDRCHYYMRRSKLLNPLAQDPRPDNYLEQLKKLQKEIQQLQIYYRQHYRNLKSSPFYVLSAIVKTKHKHKDYFLTKEEGLYFSVQQQIDHTQELFLNKFISEMSPKNYQQNILLQKLKYYSKINRIAQKNLQGYINFTQLVNDVLNIKSQ